MDKFQEDFLKDDWFETYHLEDNTETDPMELDIELEDQQLTGSACAETDTSGASPCNAPPSSETEEDIEGSIARETEKILEEISRISTLSQAQGPKACLKGLTRLRQRLGQVKNPNQALSTIITLSLAASKHTRRGGYIKVQPTGIERRRPGVQRGTKRLPEGRPPLAAKPGKITKRRPHKLSQAIKKNIASVTSHGKR